MWQEGQAKPQAMTMVCTKLLAYNLPPLATAAAPLLSHQSSRSTPKLSLFSSFSSIFAFNSHNPVPLRTLPIPYSSPSPPPSPSNLDEDGVVQNMEIYLNNLSLEYESVWDTKPVWCQPWTIVLTGLVAVLVSWLALKSLFVTAIVTSVIGLWWFLFLYSYPQGYSEMIAERRKRIRKGDEDTYGNQTNAN